MSSRGMLVTPDGLDRFTAMVATSGSSWGPAALPILLVEQLEDRGLAPNDAPMCVQQITAAGSAAPTAWFVDLGGCRLLAGDVDGAMAAWRHAVASTDAVAASRALLNIGLLYEHLGLHQKALPALTTTSQRRVEPFATQAALASARCQRALGQLGEAMETMARVAEALVGDAPSDDLSEVMLGLGDVASEAGRVESAERAWLAASGGTGSFAQAARARLVALAIEHDRDDELLGLISSSESPTDEVAAMVLDRALVLVGLGRTRVAHELSALIDPSTLAVPTRFRLAQVRRQLGHVNEAIDEYESLLRDDDGGVRQRAGFGLAEIYQSYKMVDAAASVLEPVIREADGYWSPRAERLLAELRVASTTGEPGSWGPAPGPSGGASIGVDLTDVDPVIVVLSEVGAGSTPRTPVGSRAEEFALSNGGGGRGSGGSALASDGEEHAPSTRNPYAELAPNFDATTFELPDNVQPGDWESLLGQWTADNGPDPVWEPPNKSPRKRAFSRYT